MTEFKHDFEYLLADSPKHGERNVIWLQLCRVDDYLAHFDSKNASFWAKFDNRSFLQRADPPKIGSLGQNITNRGTKRYDKNGIKTAIT